MSVASLAAVSVTTCGYLASFCPIKIVEIVNNHIRLELVFRQRNYNPVPNLVDYGRGYAERVLPDAEVAAVIIALYAEQSSTK